jgi:D-alanyl-D-alanine carboxypeptidase
MKTNFLVRLAALFASSLLAACCSLPGIGRDPVDPAVYDNPVTYVDQTATHPRAAEFAAFTGPLDESRFALPGFAVLFQDTSGIWADAAGCVDLDFGVPWKANTRCRIGSITKTFVSVVCLKLSEAGLVDLDAKASRYLPQAVIAGIENADLATVRQLLNHTSGIFSWSEDAEWSRRVLREPEPVLRTRNEALDLVRGRHAYFPPGQGFHYSNTNYELLGILAENVTGENLADLIDEKIVTPLGLLSTGLASSCASPDFIPRGYMDMRGNGRLTDFTERELPADFASGGMYSTIYDLGLFIRAIAFDRAFLSQNLLDQMIRRGHEDSTILSHYDSRLDDSECLGITTMSYNGKTWLANSGGCLGYTSYVAVCLETGETFALVVNGAGGKIGKTILEEILLGALNNLAS